MIYPLAQTATIERKTGQSGSKPSYGDPETVQCRIESVTAVQMSGDMAQRVSTTCMYVNPIEKVPIGSRVVYDGTEYTVGHVEEAWGFTLNHLELMLI